MPHLSYADGLTGRGMVHAQLRGVDFPIENGEVVPVVKANVGRVSRCPRLKTEGRLELPAGLHPDGVVRTCIDHDLARADRAALQGLINLKITSAA